MTPAETAAMAQGVLDTHHALLKRELPRLGQALQGASPQISAPFEHLRRLLESHLMKEESILFPAILGLARDGQMLGCGLEGPIRQMEAEHDEIRSLETALREAARDAGPLETDLLAMLDDLVEHARKEDEELFPAALALLPPSEEEARPVGPPVRETRATCPTCLQELPAQLVVEEGKAWLVRTCPEHGEVRQLMSNHGEEWADLDSFYFKVNPGSYPQRDYIVRMTEKCNLDCPICLARANTDDTPDLPLEGLEDLLSSRRGLKIDLMAAEPTLRADLVDWVRTVKSHGHIAALHTNGLKLAHRPYAERLKEAGVDEVFLQFDGFDDEANKRLRGRPLLKARLAAVENLRALDIPTSLIVVIGRGLNEAQVSEVLRWALRPENAFIREVFYLGLRSLGSARDAKDDLLGSALMPDEILDLLCEQEPRIKRQDVRDFNKLYFSMLSAFEVRKCLYVQHYLVVRDRPGWRPISDVLDMARLGRAAERYGQLYEEHPHRAKLGLAGALVREGIKPGAWTLAPDLLRLEHLFAQGMNLGEVPRRMLLLGFITACDPLNWDAQVSLQCGKGELSVDGGFTESGADANVARERRH